MSWRRFRPQAAWGLALVLGAPALARAQQTGLFPLAPIRRERVPCPAEDPVYGLYRQQYFGYFPTCWRRFPPGWGCPSPEAPNAAQSFQALPLQMPSEPPPEYSGEPGEGAPGAMEPEPLPGERAPAPRMDNVPPLPPNRRSPFDLDTPPDNAPRTNPPGGRSQPSPSTPGAGGPRTESSDKPEPPTAGRPEPAEAPAPDAPGEPLLALPEPSSPATAAPGPDAAPSPASLPLPSASVPGGAPAPDGAAAPPAQAPQRRGLIGSLISGLKRR